MQTKVLRCAGIVLLGSGAVLIIVSGLADGWASTMDNVTHGVSHVLLAPKAGADWTYGTWRAHRETGEGNPTVFAAGFSGPVIGMADYSERKPFSACSVSFWRIRESDPKGVVVFAMRGPGECERIELDSLEPPADLPAWADELACVRGDGSEQTFAVTVDRVPDGKERGWMSYYNRTVVAVLERQRVSQGHTSRSDT